MTGELMELHEKVDALDTENSNLKKEFSDSDSDDSITNE
jgi:hypothetical protein